VGLEPVTDQPKPGWVGGEPRQRVCGFSDVGRQGPFCGADPVMHFWAIEGLLFACSEHVDNACASAATIRQAHAVDADCGMPGASWDKESNRCIVPDDFLVWPETVARAAELGGLIPVGAPAQ
jgi:hypothetical protein